MNPARLTCRARRLALTLKPASLAPCEPPSKRFMSSSHHHGQGHGSHSNHNREAHAPPPQHQLQPGAPASSSGSMSFIERAKVEGANTLLGAFLANGNKFDRVLDGLRVTRVTAGEVEALVEVTEGLQNSYGSLHGGATCTLIDVLGTIALLSVDPSRGGVSVDLNVSFTNAAKLGERVRCVGRVLKSGKRLGFTQVDLYREDGTLVASGRHTKAL